MQSGKENFEPERRVPTSLQIYTVVELSSAPIFLLWPLMYVRARGSFSHPQPPTFCPGTPYRQPDEGRAPCEPDGGHGVVVHAEALEVQQQEQQVQPQPRQGPEGPRTVASFLLYQLLALSAGVIGEQRVGERVGLPR